MKNNKNKHIVEEYQGSMRKESKKLHLHFTEAFYNNRLRGVVNLSLEKV
jgi:hypothetical protein